MANEKLTDKSQLTTKPADDDLLHIVDVSDTAGSPEGTSKKQRIDDFLKGRTFQSILGCLVFKSSASPSKSTIAATDLVIYASGSDAQDRFVVGLAKGSITSVPTDFDNDVLFDKFVDVELSQTKVNGIDFQGGVTTTIRDAFDVPSGSVYLIYNTTTQQFEYSESDDVWKTIGLSEGVNNITDPFYLANSLVNSIELGTPASGLYGNQYFLRAYGGGQPNGRGILFRENTVELLLQTIADIDAGSGKSVITKEWFVANNGSTNRKFNTNWKIADGNYTSEDFILTSLGNEGTRSSVGVRDGNTHTLFLSDGVISAQRDYPVMVLAQDGTIITELEPNGYTFQTPGGVTTGDIWTVTNDKATGIIDTDTGAIYVDRGVVSNSTPPATYTEGNALNGIINENDLDGITWNASDFTVTSIVDPEDAGKFALRVERIAATGSAYDFDIPLTGLVSATTYTVSFRANRTAAANYFQVRLRTVAGSTSDETVTPLSAFSDLTFAAQAATATPPSINLRALGGGSPGDVLIIKDLIATPQ